MKSGTVTNISLTSRTTLERWNIVKYHLQPAPFRISNCELTNARRWLLACKLKFVYILTWIILGNPTGVIFLSRFRHASPVTHGNRWDLAQRIGPHFDSVSLRPSHVKKWKRQGQNLSWYHWDAWPTQSQTFASFALSILTKSLLFKTINSTFSFYWIYIYAWLAMENYNWQPSRCL